MDEATYLRQWIASYDPNDPTFESSIVPDWGEKQGAEDLNHVFRSKLIAVLYQTKTPCPELALALLEAETEYCEVAECMTQSIQQLGEIFFVLSKGFFVNEYKACKEASFDTYHGLIPCTLSDAAMEQLTRDRVIRGITSDKEGLDALNEFLKR